MGLPSYSDTLSSTLVHFSMQSAEAPSLKAAALNRFVEHSASKSARGMKRRQNIRSVNWQQLPFLTA